MNKPYDFTIKASTSIEGYFVHRCERNLVYGGLKPGSRADFGLNKPNVTGGVVAAKAGELWEQEVLEKKIRADRRACKKTGKGYGKYNKSETKKLISSLSSEVLKDHEPRYIYQGELAETECFRQMFFHFDKALYDGSDPYLHVHMGRTYPDFIRLSWDDASEKVIISIVDCKLAAQMRLQHKAQITLYSALLQCMVKEWHEEGLLLSAEADTTYAYLWNRGQEEEQPFLLSSTSTLLDEFFEEKLPALLTKFRAIAGKDRKKDLLGELDVNVSQTCEWCENFYQCRQILQDKGSYSLLPYLSGYAQEHARAIGAPDTLDGLAGYIEDDANKARLRGNRSWDLILEDGTLLEVHRRAYPYSLKKIKGDKDDPAYSWKRNARSYTLPRGQKVALFLTAQKDVGTGNVCLLGYQKTEWVETEDKWSRDNSQFICMAKKQDEASYLENASAFINGLCDLLTSLDGENAQAYVMDPYEKKNLEDMLYDMIDREKLSDDIRSKGMQILLWIQGDRIVTDSDIQPGTAIDTPIIVIIHEIRKLLSLPLPIAYSLRGIQTALHAYVEKEFLFNKDDNAFFESISDAVRSEVFHEYWDGGKISEDLIKSHISKRFAYAASILSKLQKEGKEKGYLLNSANDLKLPAPMGLQPIILAKWAFENRNEELLSYHDIRQSRMQDLDTAIREGSIVRATLENVTAEENRGYTNTFLYLKIDSMGDYRAQRWFSALIVAEDCSAEMYRYPDYYYSGLFPRLGGSYSSGVLNFPEWDYRDGNYYLKAQLKGNSSFEAVKGHVYYLSERYADINSSKTDAAIRNINSLADHGIRLIDPKSLDHPTGESYANDKKALQGYSCIEDTDFTDSQAAAFAHFYERGLTVLQGPPGTGKTDFIARAVITLCRFYKEKKKRDLRVLISANSHAAIENALFGVAKKLLGNKDIDVIKADRFDESTDDCLNGVSAVASEAIAEMLAGALEKPIVVGATNWACNKMGFKDVIRRNLFDIIIIDEASQVRVMDAMIGLSLAGSATRFLFVGDDDQLPPILHGSYKKEPGVPYDYGSVFRYYRDRAGNNGYSLMLGEDFRMNEILLRYSAEKIYGSAYHAFNSIIEKRHLEYKYTDAPEWIRYALDGLRYEESDYWPLVFCRISGGTADEQAELECRLVTEMTAILRTSIGDGCTDDEFWNDSNSRAGIFGIISPHHKHIEKLKDSISDKTSMKRDDLFIGTVDKLQGQERDAIIVSYGVTDIEQASVEGEFIFSRNRLNVSLTRAKCKSVIFFSEVLTHCPIELYSSDDEDVQKGADFVCGLYDFMKRSEADTEISGLNFEFEVNGDKLTVEICRKKCTISNCFTHINCTHL